MKQLLFVIIIAVVGYFIFQGGVGRVFSKANINTKGLLADITQTIDENYIPDIAQERSNFRESISNSLGNVKTTVFMTYDPEVCFSLIDIVYSSGGSQAETLINEYLSMFTLPEDRAKILGLLGKYKDRQTLRILLNLYKNGTLGRVSLLNALSVYHTPEVAQIINNAVSSENAALSQTAAKLEESFAEQKWYKDGLKVKINDSNQASIRDFDEQVKEIAQS